MPIFLFVTSFVAAAQDFDGDGFPQPGDCDDADPLVHPGAVESVGDSVDMDCNGSELCYLDADNDGARTSTIIPSADLDCVDVFEAIPADPLDCDDANATISPFALEITGDGIDSTCNGVENCYVDTDDDGARTSVVDVG